MITVLKKCRSFNLILAITPHERYKEVYFYQQRSTSGVLVKCRRRAFAEKTEEISIAESSRKRLGHLVIHR